MENIETKFCKHCGAQISADSTFCESCGKKLETSTDNIISSQTVTKTESSKDKPFHWSDDDIHKPNEIKKHCRTCGAIINENAQFCPNCRASQYAVVPANLKKCKYCGGDMAATFKSCPHCGKRVKNYTAAYICLGILLFLFFCMIILALFSPDDDNPTENTTTVQQAETSTPIPTSQKKELDLYSDDNVNIKYMKLTDESSLGMLFLQLRVTNNSGRNVIVMLKDVSVNKMSVNAGTALPIKIEPGNMSVSPFVLYAGNTGIENASEVNNIRFKLEMLDENYHTIHTTTTVNLNL